jgi:hypothetical protein
MTSGRHERVPAAHGRSNIAVSPPSHRRLAGSAPTNIARVYVESPFIDQLKTLPVALGG